MARRLIGLDIGTNAIAVAEVVAGDPPRLTAFGQVALPRDAMREGEVAQDAAVTEALKRLRSEVGIRKAPVRLGIASPRLVVRQIEMPVMSRSDLAGALRFQIQDLIPIPADEAVVDFAILDEFTPVAGGAHSPGDADPVMRVLLAAAQRSSVLRLIEVVEAAGLPVESVDLIPLALVRSLATTIAGGGGAEGIVSIGGGVTSVVVHEAGAPRFVRVLGTGGRALTDAIVASLESSPDVAESLKRQIGIVEDDAVNQARTATERPLSALLDEIRSSLDYYRNQPGASRLERVQLTGGGAQMHGVRERLSTLLGVPVERGAPRSRLTVDDIGFTIDELPRLDPYLGAAVGLAMGATDRTPAINLLPEHDSKREATWISGKTLVAAVGAAALITALAVPTVQKRSEANDSNFRAATQEKANRQTQTQIDALAAQAAVQDRLKGLTAQVSGALATDVSWAALLNEIARTMPNNVWLTGLQGSLISAVPSNAARATKVAVSSFAGSITFTVSGLDYVAVADWLRRIGQMPAFSNLWVPQAQQSQLGGRTIVTFQSSASLTETAKSDRATKLGSAK